MNPSELLTATADALADLNPDWPVHPAPVDALEPPAFMLAWGDPWLVPATFCHAFCQLEVIVVAPRLEPDTNYLTLNAMVAAATSALHTAGLPARQTSPPGPLEIAQITYLAARILIRQPVEET